MARVREVLASPLPADEAMAALCRFGNPRNRLVLNTQQARAPQLEALLRASLDDGRISWIGAIQPNSAAFNVLQTLKRENAPAMLPGRC